MQLRHVTGVDEIPSCLDLAVQSGAELSSQEAREIIIALLLYFKDHEIDQRAAKQLIVEWQNQQPETLVGRGAGDLSEILIDNEIRRAYSSKEKFSCELARKCAYIDRQRLCETDVCLYLDKSNSSEAERTKSRGPSLIEAINQRIPIWISDNYFKTVSDTEKLYRYNDGAYHDDGEIVLKGLIESEFGGMTSNKLVADIIGKVKRRTYINRDEFNSVPIVNLKNGILDLETLRVQPHSPGVLTTSQLPVTYNPAVTCPRINQFWREVAQPQDLRLLGEIAGWLLWPEYKIHVAIMLLGQGRNGKGTLLRLFTAFLGRENVSNVTLQDLVIDRFAKADLYGKLANIGGDIPSKDLSDTAPFRMLTGEDDNRAQEKYKAAFSFRNKAKLLFSANVLPRSPDDTYAFYARWIILEFLNKFNPEEGTGDPDLLAKLTTPEELSGLLNLALEGLARLKANRWRFSYSKTAEDVEIMYKRNANPVLAFVLDECEPDTAGYVEKGVFYERFKKYASRHGIRPITVKRFVSLLRDQAEVPLSDYRPDSPTGRALPRCWLGLKFREPASTTSMVCLNSNIYANGEEEKEKEKIGYTGTMEAVEASQESSRENGGLCCSRCGTSLNGQSHVEQVGRTYCYPCWRKAHPGPGLPTTKTPKPVQVLSGVPRESILWSAIAETLHKAPRVDRGRRGILVGDVVDRCDSSSEEVKVALAACGWAEETLTVGGLSIWWSPIESRGGQAASVEAHA